MHDVTRDADSAPLLRVEHLCKDYVLKGGLKKRILHAVKDVSFEVGRGRTLGIVGESGSGKSTTAMIVSGLVTPTSGVVSVDGVDISTLHGKDLRRHRRDAQTVFQDPHSSLSPRLDVETILMEPLKVHRYGTRAQCRDRVHELLSIVGLAQDFVSRYPHQLSGGQAQRVSIARALALNPRLLVLDEPVAALDLSIQAQILNLLARLQRELDLTYIFIGHDLAAVAFISDEIAVMREGEMVEVAPAVDIYQRPQHPYTQRLLAAVLDPVRDIGRLNARTERLEAP